MGKALSLQTVYFLPSVLNFPGVVAEVRGYPTGGLSATEDTDSSGFSKGLAPSLSSGRAGLCLFLGYSVSSQLFCLRIFRDQLSQTELVAARAWGKQEPPGAVCWFPFAVGSYSLGVPSVQSCVQQLGCLGPQTFPSTAPVPAKTSCLSPFTF